MRDNRLRQFGHVERKNNDNLVKKLGEIRVKKNWGKGQAKEEVEIGGKI